MKMNQKRIKDLSGREVILRSAEPADAEALLRYLKITASETPYLIREPEEIQMTVEAERSFLQKNLNSPKALMMIAAIDGEHIGNCSIAPVGNYQRYAHRCNIAIALYQKYCGLGIGRQMMEEALAQAAAMGYEQAELEVIAENEAAIHLYERLGFQKYGTFPDNMKYRDGKYADAYWMMKKL